MGSTGTLPRGGPLLRTYSPAVGAPVPADRIKSLPGQTGKNFPLPQVNNQKKLFPQQLAFLLLSIHS